MARIVSLQPKFAEMKRTTLIMILTIAMVGCEKKQEFTIQGKIDNAADKMLYFEANSLEGIQPIDSVRLDKSGQFHFTRKRPDGPEFFRLRIGQSIINLGVDSTENIIVKAPLDKMTTDYTIEGSEESSIIKKLSLKQMEIQKRISTLARSGMPAGILADSIDSVIEKYKQEISREYIYTNPRSAHAYYALFQRIMGRQLFNSESNRQDIRVYAAVATSWEQLYPHSLRAINLRNIALRGLKNTRKPREKSIPAEIVEEVTLLDLALPDQYGKTRRLTDLKGKVILLDFTVYQNQASPARNMALRELYNTYASQGLEVYQVSFDADQHFWKTSCDNLPWICVHDGNGSSAAAYNVTDLPTYFLIDRNNALYKRNTGIKDAEHLETEIKKLLQ